MTSRDWRTCPDQLIYQRPYEDAYGTLHDPTTEWDELLKNYKHWVMLLQVGEGTRRMAQPASIGAEKIIRKEQQRQQIIAARVNELEADYLQKNGYRKYWKRRQRRKHKARIRVACQQATSGA